MTNKCDVSGRAIFGKQPVVKTYGKTASHGTVLQSLYLIASH